MKMSQPLRIDFPQGTNSFVTRRFRNSQLCYANNPKLEKRVLGALGKYINKYEIKIYAYTPMGSHDHLLDEFKPGTKSNFFRDFGARTAEAVKMYVPEMGTGSVLERRTSEQAVTCDQETQLDRLMYTIMQPIYAGLCRNLSDYPGFNSFQYILSGEPLEVEFFKGAEYRKAKRRNKNVDPDKFIERYQIIFDRLPGYEHLSQKEYRSLLLKEYERRRVLIIEEYERNGHVWPSAQRLRSTRSTDVAKDPKRSDRYTKRPLVLSLCMEARQAFLDYYFRILEAYKKSSALFLMGDRDVEFPAGTRPPPVLCC